MKLKLLFLLILCGLTAFAQKQPDPLIEKLKKHPKKDSTRVELLIDACVKGTFEADSVMLAYAKEANSIAHNIQYELGKIRSLNCIGNYYFQKSNFDKATQYYMNALRLAEKRRDLENIVISKSNLSNIYCRVEKQQQAITLLKECDSILIKKGDAISEKRAAILTNLATSYSAIKRHDIAIEYYQKVFSICEKKNIIFGLGITSANLASEYYASKNYNKALLYAQNTLKIIEKHQLDFLKPSTYKTLGLTYSDLKQTQLGIKNLKLSELYAKQFDDKETLLTVYDNIHKAYSNIGDYKNAYQNSLYFLTVKDSMYGIESKKNIDEINAKYETEKKESEINQLKQQKEISELQSQRKNILIYTFIGSILGLIVLSYFFFIRYKTKKQNELLKMQLLEAEKTIEAEKKATDSEIKALKSQMNPHFIFNALNSIQEQFMYGDKITANEQMGNFTYLTRQILNVSGKKQIPIATEIEILTKYLELEKMRFGDNFEYQIHCNDSIDDTYVQIPPMLIQPFVENSIKHGLLHKEGEKKIAIHFNLDEVEENLICTIEDNGIGRKKSEAIKVRNENQHESFSTGAILQRLQLLNKKDNLKDMIVYEDIQNSEKQIIGTKVTVTIPLA